MKMDVEIISTEIIKPSSPTPNHLRNYKLCLLDQLIPAAYAPIVIFYPNHDHASHSDVLQRLALLKKSLSETLTRFYPLAGAIIDDLSIDCDDQGASFTTARVNINLREFLQSPDLKFIARFLPCGLTSSGFGVTNIQASQFECGGIAIGVCISHRILDGTALSTFLKSWANVARCSEEKHSVPEFSASYLFPANDSWLKDASIATWDSLFKKGQFVTKRFVFDGPAITSLKDIAARGGSTPTRVEAVSGFIWKSAIVASIERFGYKKPSLLTHIVNLRKRAAPNFSEQSLGNLIWIASSMLTAGKEVNLELSGLVNEVRKSLSRINGEYVKKLRGEQGSNTMREYLKEIQEFGSKEDVYHFGFTSWSKLGYYDVDFGWGRPVWVASIDASGPFFMNLAVLIDTRCGDGVEAWVTMDETEMSLLEHNQEFRAFAALNPSPLYIGNAAAP